MPLSPKHLKFLYVVAKKNNMPKVSKKVIFVNFDDAYLIIPQILDN